MLLDLCWLSVGLYPSLSTVHDRPRPHVEHCGQTSQDCPYLQLGSHFCIWCNWGGRLHQRVGKVRFSAVFIYRDVLML